jgi:hypothetical protein
MEWLERVFYETTDPKTPYNRLISKDVILSILLHTILYTCIVSYIFKSSKPLYIFIILFTLMYIGYFARLYRVKNLSIFLKNDKEAKERLRSAYFTWYFLG